MKKPLLLLTAFIIAACTAYAQQTTVFRQMPADQVEASASSFFKGFPPKDAVNGQGMAGERHYTSNEGRTMWISQATTATTRHCDATREGVVWFLCRIGQENTPVQTIDQIRIWNHNQNEHTRRGLKKVYIEYSADGTIWKPIPSGKQDFHLIPESVGRNPEPADFTLETPGLKARYICITAAAGGEGNHYDRQNPVVMREAADMQQNPDYYGLSEIRFYRSEKVAVKSLPQVGEPMFSFSQGYLRKPEGATREFSISFFTPIHTGGNFEFESGGKVWKDRFAPSGTGVSTYNGLFPAGYMTEESQLKVRFTSPQGSFERTIGVPAARKWEVAFLPHSHQDIGYTHRQDDVMKLQWRNIEHALDLADRTKAYPDGARFRWNTEATWSVIGYLETYAGTQKAERLLQAIRDGIINVDAPLGSILTGISRQEELMHLFDDAHRISAMTGVELTTAMMSDVPGQVWGLTTAMANNGVKYFSPGPNYVPFYGKIGNDRAAAMHIEWGDRPFYWQSQSGGDKVLVWQAGRGYSWFHGWLAGRLSVCGTEPIWDYLQELELDEFPYHTCYLRYTVHGDNGPPDEMMPEVIRAWNERYESPHFRIATTREFFTAFEERYGEHLPTYAGDMTPTWEDGAASTARETAMNRESAARLAQTEILWSMLSPTESFPAGEFDRAWKNVLLFSEHTWGASASGTDPHSKLTTDLWEGKKMYADSADMQSRRLRTESLKPLSGKGDCIQVVNTNLWPRTDVVSLDASTDLDSRCLVDAAGRMTDIQRLHDGRWAFVAEQVPALSSSVYRIIPAPKRTKEIAPMLAGNVLDNGILRLEIDTLKGTIRSLKTAFDKFEYAAGDGLNDFLHTGRLGASPQGISGVRSIEVLDNGSVAATLRIVSDAPGCNALYRDVTLYRDIRRADIVNTIDKQDITDFECLRFVFPFSIAHPEIGMDLAMSEMHPEREQLAGVNKHYYSLLNGLSAGDLEHGICLTAIDAPFVELGNPSGEEWRLNPRHGYGWWPSAQISPVVYSWVMTNSWRTNYKASQGGMAVFRYSLQPGNPFDLRLKQLGLEREQPLIVVANAANEPIAPLFRLEGRNRIAVSSITPSDDGKGYIVSLHNTGKQAVRSAFVWGGLKAREVTRCDFRQQTTGDFDPSEFWMQPYEYLILKVVTE